MTFDWLVVWRNLDVFIDGVKLTILLAVATMAIAVPGGIVLAMMRMSGIRVLAWIATAFVELFRNVPLILVIYMAYYVLPVMSGLSASPLMTGLIALSLNVSAYNGETFRAGIASIRKGQFWAASALGMSLLQSLRTVILPQAIVRMLPAFGSVISIAIKDTAIASVIAVPEYMNRSQTVAGQSFHPIEVFTVAMAVYFVILFPVTRVVDIVYVRLAHLGRS